VLVSTFPTAHQPPYHVHVVEVLEQRLRDRAAEPEQPLSQRRGGGRQPFTPGLRFLGTAHAQRGRAAALGSALRGWSAGGNVLVRSLKETMLEDGYTHCKDTVPKN